MSAFNAAASLDRAIRSIVEQTVSFWELIIVDDASTDGTNGVAVAWVARDPRISLLRNSTNVGLAASLNRAIAVSSAPLIARMDADDTSFPERLERQVSFLDAHPDVDILGCGVEFVDDRRRPLGHLRLPREHGDLIKRRFVAAPVVHPSVVIRRAAFLALGGYDARLRRAQDADLWLRGMHRGYRFANLDDILLKYHVRPPSLQSIGYGAFVILRHGIRHEREIAPSILGSLRFLVAGVLRLGTRSRPTH